VSFNTFLASLSTLISRVLSICGYPLEFYPTIK
jgi:hypothetical protein